MKRAMAFFDIEGGGMIAVPNFFRFFSWINIQFLPSYSKISIDANVQWPHGVEDNLTTINRRGGPALTGSDSRTTAKFFSSIDS